MYNHSVLGDKQVSPQGSHLDFAKYWADQTVEEAVLRGTQLRQEKFYHFPSRQYDVVNIDYIKPPRSINWGSNSRKKSKKSIKPYRSRSSSPCCQECRESTPLLFSKMSKRYKKCRTKKNKAPCGMRIAELAVPTKRQCLDTWRNKCNTLPACMIERLRQHVLDQRPVVHLSEAISCFKRKCKNRTTERAGDKNIGSKKKLKKTLWTNEVKTLGAIFGYNISQKLNIPLNIKLNSDLEKIANVISYDIADLVSKSKKIDMKNAINKAIHTEITKKVTIWISDVLEESSYKYLEDELKDFEEEAGPALDVVDDIFDGVLNICIPRPEICDRSSLSLFEAAGLEEGTLQLQTSAENISLEVSYLSEDDKIDLLTKTDEYETITEYIKNEIKAIINKIDVDIDTKSDEYLDIDGGPNLQPREDVEIDEKNDENLKMYKNVADEQITDEKSDKNLEFHNVPDERVTYDKSDGSLGFDNNFQEQLMEDDVEKKYDKNSENSEVEPNENVKNVSDEQVTYDKSDGNLVFDNNFEEQLMEGDVEKNNDKGSENSEVEPNENVESKDTHNKIDEYLDSEDGGIIELTNATVAPQDTGVNDQIFDQTAETPFENIDNQNVEGTETFADAIDNNQDEENYSEQRIDIEVNKLSEAPSDENNKKVKFDQIVDGGKGNRESISDKVNDLDTKPSIDLHDFAPRNEDLLSDADESWPDEIQPPFIRPSQSVNKSVTSLGRINENEEKISGLSDDKISNFRHEENDPELYPEQQGQDLAVKPEESISVEVEDQNLHEEQVETISEYEDKTGNKLEKEVAQIEMSVKADDEVTKSPPKRTFSKPGKTSVSTSEKEKRISDSRTSKLSNRKPSKRGTNCFKIKTGAARAGPVKAIPKTGKTEKLTDKTLPLKMSTSKAKRKNIETAGTSQSVKDLDTCLDGVEKARDIRFSSMRKPKPDYRVDAKTAPAWVTRNIGDSSCSCVHIVSKPKPQPKPKGKRNINEYEIRKWCKDVEQGYKNLKTWNEWIENSSRTICILRREIGTRGYCDKCPEKGWKKLKSNIDKDAALWKKMNLTTQERLKCYRKMYQKQTEVPKNNRIMCDCSQPKLCKI